MPVIFSSSLLALPTALARYAPSSPLQTFATALNPAGPFYLPVSPSTHSVAVPVLFCAVCRVLLSCADMSVLVLQLSLKHVHILCLPVWVSLLASRARHLVCRLHRCDYTIECRKCNICGKVMMSVLADQYCSDCCLQLLLYLPATRPQGSSRPAEEARCLNSSCQAWQGNGKLHLWYT